MSRQTIRETGTKYRLEPSLRDLFVEGKSDKSFFRWFLSRAGCADIKVRSIETIDIPVALLSSLGLSEGNKQRVIALATELNGAFGDHSLQFTCVVDTDEDRLLDTMRLISQLIWTDFASLEAYAFDEFHLAKLVHLVFGDEDSDIQAMLAAYSHVLTELFLIRAAIRRWELPVRWLDFTGCCKRTARHVQLDANKFLAKLLNASGLHQSEEQLLATIRELRERVNTDARHQLNGHDFVELLFWDQRDHARRKELRNSDAVASALSGTYEHDLLTNLPLFRAILLRCKTRQE